jgi:hypothetical protein
MVAARMSAPLCLDEMPQALLDRLAGGSLLRVERVLRLLAPWTTVTVPPEEASSVMVR